MKRAIFVRSKTTVMTELDKKIREKEIYKVTLVGSFVNFLLVIFKFLAGIAGHSAAMLADAVHSLSDFVTDVVVILFVRISNKPVDKSHDYGHGKYETLATAFIGMALLGIGFGILWNGATEILVFSTRWGASSTGNVGIGCCHYFYFVEGNTFINIQSEWGKDAIHRLLWRMHGIIGVMHYHPLVRLSVLAERFYLVLIGRYLILLPL